MDGPEKTQRLRRELTRITQNVLDTVDKYAVSGKPNPTGIYESSLLLNFTAEGGEHYSATVIVRDHSAMPTEDEVKDESI